MTPTLESPYRLNASAAILCGKARALRLRLHAQRSPLSGPAESPVPGADTSRGGLWDGSSRHARGDGSAVAPGPTSATSEDTKARG